MFELRQLVAPIFSPLRTSADLFTPEGYGGFRTTVERIATWRSFTGLVTIVVASAPTRPVLSVLDDAETKAVETALLAVVVVLAAMAVIWLRTPTSRRPALVPEIRFVLSRIGLAVLVVGLPTALVVAFVEWQHDRPMTAWGVLVTVAIVFALVPYLLFIARMIYFCARTSYCAARVHPMLAPICAATVVLVTTGSELYWHDTRGLPDDTWLTLTLGGLGTTLALAAWEYFELHRRGERLV